MADTLKKYDLECPGCEEEFTVEYAPAQLADGGELIECPNCFNEWEWEYDPDTGTLELIDDTDESDDGLEDPMDTETLDEEEED